MKVKLSKLFIQHPAGSSACLGFFMALFTTGCVEPNTIKNPLSSLSATQEDSPEVKDKKDKKDSQLIVESTFVTKDFQFGEHGKVALQELFEAKALSHSIAEYKAGDEIYILKILDENCVKASLTAMGKFDDVVDFYITDFGSCDPEKFGEPSISILVSDIDGNDVNASIVFSIDPPKKEDAANEAPAVLQSKIDIQLPAGEVSGIDVKSLLGDAKAVEDKDGDAITVGSLTNDDMKAKVDVQVSKDGGTIRFDATTLIEKDVYQFQIYVTDGKNSAEEAITIVVSLIDGKTTAEGKDIK